MNPSRCFSSSERRELTTPYPRLIRKSLKRSDTAAALAWCDEMQGAQVRLHDFLAESCTVLWSWVGEQLGEARLPEMFRAVFAQAARRQFFAAATVDAPPHLAVLLLAKSWRAHSCHGAGEHPGQFSITEDAEKFTFHLHPCGSGLRLWRKGFYDQPGGGRRTRQAHSWSYGRKDFPYYCLHCPFLNEILPYESPYGTLLWPVDPPDGPGDDCAWHIYKDRNRIPERYYARLGLEKRRVAASRFYDAGRRYFSETALQDLARPRPQWIREKIAAGHTAGADRLCREAEDEFLVLHDLYVNMLSATLTYITGVAGEAALGRALRRQYDRCLAPVLAGELAGLSPKEKAVFLARQVFGPDACNQTGRFPASFSLTETSTDLVFWLSPCGSGGRLLQAGAHRRRPLTNRLKEATEETVLRLSARYLPWPESWQEKLFPVVIDLFTQRKPWQQGQTQQARSWSFDRPHIPYYCCQCGLIADIWKDCGLTIIPPSGPQKPCLWKIRKN